MSEKKLSKKPYPLGAHIEDGKIRFAFVSAHEDCGVLLFDKVGKLKKKLPFTQEEKIGNVYCKYVENVNPDKVSYLFYDGERKVVDERARVFCTDGAYGKERSPEEYRAGFVTDEFDWENDRNPCIPYKDALIYCLHVRGFTKHPSSGVKGKGTFAGMAEKIPYLQEIGVTCVELQPAYEFTEMATFEERREKLPGGCNLTEAEMEGLLGENKLNYWGYKKGFYYAPKAAYAASGKAVREFKEMVRAFHHNHMEVVMQFYFPKGISAAEIGEILRFWVIEYHVDGFHLMGEGFSAESLAADPVLADTKLWFYRFDTDQIYRKEEVPAYCNLAEYNDNWYYDMRKYLKGDENMLSAVLYHMRHVPEKRGCIHYLSNYFGFTLYDLVSYDYKHNEENGEENRDGTDYNCSWNCGEEGPTRKAKIKQLRTKQIKNAFVFLLLSQSTPLIFMGDEFGNTQNGNNNPYCQDNGISWLNWNLTKKNSEILTFWKSMVSFRRNHPVLTPAEELKLMDYIACGYPDLSYHGENAWRVQVESYYRHAGIMLCGKYAKIDRRTEDVSVYIAMNMHWENHTLALPKPPKGCAWKPAFATATQDGAKESADESKHPAELQGLLVEVAPRSVAVYVTEAIG